LRGNVIRFIQRRIYPQKIKRIFTGLHRKYLAAFNLGGREKRKRSYMGAYVNNYMSVDRFIIRNCGEEYIVFKTMRYNLFVGRIFSIRDFKSAKCAYP